MFEDFTNALQNFKRQKTRTILSLLGVIIGVASVIVITSMGSSSTQEIKNTFGTAGLDVVSISSGLCAEGRVPRRLPSTNRSEKICSIISII
jgi:permease, putative